MNTRQMVTSNICFPCYGKFVIYLTRWSKPCSFVVFKLLRSYISEKTSSDSNNLVPLLIVIRKCGLDQITINCTTGVLRKYCQSLYLQAFIQSIRVCSVDCSFTSLFANSSKLQLPNHIFALQRTICWPAELYSALEKQVVCCHTHH